VIDIPPIKPEITEFRCHELKCEGCGVTTRAPIPEEARSLVGDRLGALICLMMGQYRLSKRMVQALLSDLLGVELSLGMVPKVGMEMSEALAPAVEEAKAYVREQDAVNADETGWFEGKSEGRNRRAWLWVFPTQLVVVFCIAPSRGSQVVKSVLGEDFTGFLTTDRWSAYNWYDTGLRQLCWSHLTRDFQSFVERGGEAGRIGEALLQERNRMFEWWHRVRDGTMTQEELEHRMKEVEHKVGQLLRKAAVCPDNKVAGTAQEILKLEKAMWTFVQVPGLEPTNNFSERCIRHAVMWRKTSFGTQSPKGSRFVERILTVVATLKLQQRNVLEFLTQSLAAHRRGQRGPSLLPSMPAKPLALVA
jgi:transposase